MPRRPIVMQAFGTTTPTRGQRVASSTCPRPQVSNDQTLGGLADEFSVNETAYHLSGAEYHVVDMLGQGSITAEQAYQALSDLNS